MKNATLLLITVLVALTFNPVFSKEKKKKKKDIERENMIEAAISPYKDKVAEMENKVAQLEKEIEKLNKENEILMEENKALQKEAMESASQPETSGPVIPDGIAFKVQLGAYSASVTAMFTEEKFLQTEKVEGKNKYVIGFFTDYETAKQAVKDFKKLGIRDAWFVPYNNGQRISDKEANKILNFDIRKK
jgi:TolA-binding protein